jgi:hypothetical protein
MRTCLSGGECAYPSAAVFLVDAVCVLEGAIDGVVDTNSEDLSHSSSNQRDFFTCLPRPSFQLLSFHRRSERSATKHP